MGIRAFVVDDSAFYRKLVTDILSSQPGVEVVGSAASCEEALAGLRRRMADLVFCDVHMPVKDGVATLAEVRAMNPDIMVVMISGSTTRNAEETVQALQMGALDFIHKPDGDDPRVNEAKLRSGIISMLRLAAIHRNTAETLKAVRPLAERLPETTRPAGPRVPDTFTVVAVGASTGGPEALAKLLPSLPQSFPVPLLVVQHMPVHYTTALAQSLERKSKIRVVEAQDGQAVQPGTAYIAPGGRHMTVARVEGQVVVRLSDGEPVHNCRPSVDVLFRSVAEAYAGRGVVAVVLTGMGDDGVEGVRVLKERAACHCVTQSASSCVVYGMPRGVAEAGLADRALPLEDIGPEICLRVRKAGG